MSTSAHSDPHNAAAAAAAAEAWKYADKALTWYGWGSPVGLGLFLVSLGIVLVLIHQAGLLR